MERKGAETEVWRGKQGADGQVWGHREVREWKETAEEEERRGVSILQGKQTNPQLKVHREGIIAPQKWKFPYGSQQAL